MTHLASASFSANQEFAIADYSASNSGTDRDVDHIVDTNSCPETVLTQSCYIGVVSDEHRDA